MNDGFRVLSPYQGVRVKVFSEVMYKVYWSDVAANSDTRKLVLTTSRRRAEDLGNGGVQLKPVRTHPRCHVIDARRLQQLQEP